MSISLAGLRYRIQRTLGLIRRGLTSLRTRGWQASWERAQLLFRREQAPLSAALYFPTGYPLAVDGDDFMPFVVPASVTPRASVVIPVYNQLAHTLACLHALADHPPQAACEIIIIDDGSSDRSGEWLPRIEGLRYHRRAENGGFVAACNDGAAVARGEYVVFLNNDTVPQPGWLDALLATFETHPDAGLVGAQLLYPDGRLQEAGGQVFADGSGWNRGRFESPDDPRYACLREVDYCSGAAIAVPRALFSRLGGFDTRYAPAYYEDTDLAFAVRAAGRRVLYQPLARVVHAEGATAGTDTGQGIKAYQLRNRDRFRDKWRGALHDQPAPGSRLSDAVPGRCRILVIADAGPRPDRDSGSLRLFNLMRLLDEEGAQVVFLPADRRHDGDYTRALQGVGVQVWYAPWLDELPNWLREHGGSFDTVMVCRYHLAEGLLPLLRQHAPQARVVFDSVDLHYLRETRGAELAGDAASKRAAAATRERELAVIAGSDVTLVVSANECELLRRDAPQARVEIVSNLHRPAGPGLPFAQRRDLVFVGGFGHPPNADAVLWFAREVFPRVRERLPDVRFHCIGSNPPAAVRALQDIPGVIVHGHVPELTPWMEGARIAVAPLRYGAGVKGKINLSMAHGQPVVATTCAAEGMHLRDGIDARIADSPDAFADTIVRLYGDEESWNSLARNGLQNVATHFSIDAARAAVRRVFFTAAADQTAAG
ncbi:glycosyl transferase [Pseudoxanthomonas kalamensis DSM 18571]|uniref:glycosyltransferase n=1 Tax=Pseudoxanthomonas kalamensis TaxID=289483 RepID=UPI0013907AE2|nr:glycosyltransferase [Pseudoxanthomonas kalamensis]KAF1709229.1 glycosyl transferase [Pseudoxanthomonas kalamensis DSM 18571]